MVSSRSWAAVKREGLTTCQQNGGFGAPYIHRMVFTSVLSTFPLVFLVPSLFLVPMMFDARLRLYVHAYLPTIPHSITVSTSNFCHTMRIDWSRPPAQDSEYSCKNRLQTNFHYVIVAYINLWFIYDPQIFLTLSFLTITINPHPCNKLHILAPSKVSAQ